MTRENLVREALGTHSTSTSVPTEVDVDHIAHLRATGRALEAWQLIHARLAVVEKNRKADINAIKAQDSRIMRVGHKRAGLCSICGKTREDPQFVSCARCRARSNSYYKKQ